MRKMMRTRDRLRVIRRVLHEHVVEDRGYKTPCWIWTGSVRNGRGQIGIWGRSPVSVPRALLAALGELDLDDPTTCALHKCDVGMCVRRDHLYIGTKHRNTLDMLERGRDGHGLNNTSEARIRCISTPTLTEKQVKEIQVMEGTQRAIAETYGITQPTVSRIKSDRTWKHIK